MDTGLGATETGDEGSPTKRGTRAGLCDVYTVWDLLLTGELCQSGEALGKRAIRRGVLVAHLREIACSSSNSARIGWPLAEPA